MRKKIYDEAVKRIDGIREVTSRGSTKLNDLNQFMALNKRKGTGGLESLLPNMPQLHGTDYNNMVAMQRRLGPAERIQGSGASSDRDVSLFMGGLPSVEQGGNTNKAITQDFQRQYDYALNKQTFLTDYLQKNGHLNGADEQWTSMNQPKDNGQNNIMPPDEKMPTGQKFDAMPRPDRYKGKTMRDDSTGKRYQSNGLQWKEVR